MTRVQAGLATLSAGVLLSACAFMAIAGEPALPSGLDGPPRRDEPPLPPGLSGGEDAPSRDTGGDRTSWFRDALHGFVDARTGVRTGHDPHERDFSLGEMRLQADVARQTDRASVRLVGDFVYDAMEDAHEVDLESGDGWFDLREANVMFTPLPFLDVKLGRQMMTWGTGDQVFINDLFPKDWIAFFSGRDTEYLKAPSDAMKASIFHDALNMDIVYMPRFDADRFVNGGRISFFHPLSGGLSGREAILDARQPHAWFRDDELALRLYRNFHGYESAVYAYRGFWKSPQGFDPFSGTAVFPKLSVYGASIRGVVGSGIGSLEFGYYDSRQDRGGDDPWIPNSQLRYLIAYERELTGDFRVGVQYYLEHMLEYDDLAAASPPGAPVPDELRHMTTLRVTGLFLRQDLEFSLFAFYSPSDQDAYVRPRVFYKVNDDWSVEMGGNVFLGREDDTFFGQFRNNSNIYAGMRWNY